jgi:hypothetical protein
LVFLLQFCLGHRRVRGRRSSKPNAERRSQCQHADGQPADRREPPELQRRNQPWGRNRDADGAAPSHGHATSEREDLVFGKAFKIPESPQLLRAQCLPIALSPAAPICDI